jgi:PHD/YefM family antitoxin component YafN of YafNO toxin-antitoxin module
MREYSFTQARQHFASILEEAKKEGVVCIKKRDGQTFYLKPATPKKSPLDVEGVDLGLSSTEIVELLRKGRERQYDQ